MTTETTPTIHRSDCAVHNEPAMPAGPCDCGATETKPATDEEIAKLRAAIDGTELMDAAMLALIARITTEREAREEAEDRVEELEREAEKVAAEFEGDATQALGRLANEFDDTFHEWAEREGGWTVDNAAQAIFDGRADLLRQITASRERADKAEADCDAWCKSYDEQGKVLNAIRTERDALAAQLAEARQQIAALREALKEAHPYVEMAEFLGSRAFSHSGGYPEPSPAEWGIRVPDSRQQARRPSADRGGGGMTIKKTMTEQLYRRRAGEPVQVWRVGDGEPPEWAQKVSRKHFGKSAKDWWSQKPAPGEGWIVTEAGAIEDARDFAHDYEPLPAPAPDAREALEAARNVVNAYTTYVNGRKWEQLSTWGLACSELRQALARIGGGASARRPLEEKD